MIGLTVLPRTPKDRRPAIGKEAGGATEELVEGAAGSRSAESVAARLAAQGGEEITSRSPPKDHRIDGTAGRRRRGLVLATRAMRRMLGALGQRLNISTAGAAVRQPVVAFRCCIRVRSCLGCLQRSANLNFENWGARKPCRASARTRSSRLNDPLQQRDERPRRARRLQHFVVVERSAGARSHL